MKEGLKRATSLLLALVMFVTACFAELPEGSLSFLGGFGEQVASLFESTEAEAGVSSTTKFNLPTAYSTKATISEIGRTNEAMWFFDCKSDTGSKDTVFCMNSGKSLGSNDTYKYTKTAAVTYAAQGSEEESLAKAMTWWFGSTDRDCVNQGSFKYSSSSTLDKKMTHAAVQAYVWATCTSSASKETTVKQVLKNYCGLSDSSAKTWASRIVKAIDGTYVYGSIYYYTLKTCGHSPTKSADKHQTMLSWSPDGTVAKTDSVQLSGTGTGSVTVKLQIYKLDNSTEAYIDTAKFKVTYSGEKLEDGVKVSISGGKVTKVSFDTTTGSRSGNVFTTKGGKIVFKYKIEYETNSVTSTKYNYVTNWDSLDYWTQKSYSDKGYYSSKSKATSAAKTSLNSKISSKKTSVETSIKSKKFKVTETQAPVGHKLPNTTYKESTAASSTTLTFTFKDSVGNGSVTVNKLEGTSTAYNTKGASLKGAVYGVYANETIYKSDNKTKLYSKNDLITKITTNSKGVASTDDVLRVGYSYYVKEITASPGYELDTAKHEFTIDYDNENKKVESATVSSYEAHTPIMYYGKVSIIKSLASNSGYDVDNASVEGAQYTVYAGQTIYDENGKKIYDKDDPIKSNGKNVVLTTNSKGYAQSGEVIPAGDSSRSSGKGYKYYLKETKASSKTELSSTKYVFYVLVSDSQSVTVKDGDGNAVNGAYKSGDSIKAVKTVNDPVQEMRYGSVAITKKFLRSAAYVGDDATVSGATYQVYAAETIKDVDGTVLFTAEQAVTYNGSNVSITTNSTGFGKSVKGIPAGDSSKNGGKGYKYYLRETDPSTGCVKSLTDYYFYVLVDSNGNVTVKDGSGKDVSGSSASNSQTVEEDTIWGSVQIYKYTVDVDGTTAAESGAKFALVKASAVRTATGTTSNAKAASKINGMTASERETLVKGISSASILTTLTTNAAGFASYYPVPYGTYFLIQTAGTESYELTQDYFTISSGNSAANVVTRTLYNERNPAYINISKYLGYRNSAGKFIQTPESGAVFYVLYADKVNKTCDELSKMETTSERRSYVNGLGSSAIVAALTTDSDGEASVKVNAGESYIIFQVSGTSGYALADAEEKTFEPDEIGTYYYEATNPEDYSKFTITKNLADQEGNTEGAEADATFVLVKASYVKKTAAELNAMDASERNSYVNSLGSACRLATLVTGDDGTATAYWRKSTYSGDFVVIQTTGTDGYAVMPVLYSKDATAAGGASVMTKTTGTDSDGLDYTAYSFEYDDEYDGYTYVSIEKQLADKGGNVEGPEGSAEFVVIKASAVTENRNTLDEMEAAGRAAYVETISESDILLELTTDDEGTASGSWSDLDYEGDFVVIQTSGMDNYKLMPVMYSAEANDTGKNSGGDTVMTLGTTTDIRGHSVPLYSISWNDEYEGDTSFEITKTITDADGNNETAEVEAVFAVIKSGYVDETEDALNAMDAQERSDYVYLLEYYNSGCILGEITTDPEGYGSVTWKDKDYAGSFVVIQTAGRDGYALMPVLYSGRATSTGYDESGNAVMSKVSDSRSTVYSFSYADIFTEWAMIDLYKQYESANGEWKIEAGAEFAVTDDSGIDVAWITTDDTGYGVAVDADGNTAKLAVGIYYINQTATGTGADNTELLEGEPVVITESDTDTSTNATRTVTYEGKNPSREYEFTVTKLSDDTDAPVEGATYTIIAAEDILDGNGKTEYSKGDVVRTVVTDADGEGVTWIPYGYYYIEESESPYDFETNTEKVYFTINEDGITVSGGVTSAAKKVTEMDDEGNTSTHYSVSYTTYDTPVYGTLYVSKQGAYVSGSTGDGVFEFTGDVVAGATYALYARDNILDDAGNVVWSAGQLITTAVTGDDGTAQFFWDKDGDEVYECADFYMGNYYVVETDAPEGFAIDTEEHDITLVIDRSAVTENEGDYAEVGSVSDTGGALGSAAGYETSGQYVLMTGSDFNKMISEATTVTFTYGTSTSSTKVDVSHDGDGSVWMWNDGSGNYYVSTCVEDQPVIFNGDSSYMFYNCRGITDLTFDTVDTSQVCDMSYMFYFCTGLTVLDLETFDTTNVGDMSYMFYACTALATIYVTEPADGDTDYMFSTSTWTTGISAATAGNLMDGDDITVEDFVFTRYYTADYVVEDIPEDITLTSGDIASITPSVASSDDLSVVWIDANTYTIDVTITLAESCPYYCTNGTYSNELTVKATVEMVQEIEPDYAEAVSATAEVDETPITVDIVVYKEDGSGNALAGAEFTLYANCDILDADGNVLYNAGEAIMTQTTLGEESPSIMFSGLPSGMYADEDTYLDFASDAIYCTAYTEDGTADTADGGYMFYIVETQAPSGYGIAGGTWYLSGQTADYEENAEGKITYTFTAINDGLDYLTLEKAWDDSADSSARPDYVVFEAAVTDGTSYTIVVYEDAAYLFASASAYGSLILDGGVTDAGWLDYALCSWSVTEYSDYGENGEIAVWSVALDNETMTIINADSDFTSPFDTDSGYTFAENETLLEEMTVQASSADLYYRIEGSEGWTNADKTIWRTTNATIIAYTSASVVKTWDDYEDEKGTRPTELSVTLWQRDSQGNEILALPQAVTLDKNNDWSYTTGLTLELYDGYGIEYEYYWVEEEVTGYEQESYEYTYDSTDNVWYTYITNSTDVTTTATVRKVWADESDAQHLRPDVIYMQLYANGMLVDVEGNEVTGSTTADTAVKLTSPDWEAEVDGLPKYNAKGKEISYTFKEVTSAKTLIVDGSEVTLTDSDLAWYTGDSSTGYAITSTSYGTTGTGTVNTATAITNTHTPSGSITVKKGVLVEDIEAYYNAFNEYPSFTFELSGTGSYSQDIVLVFDEDDLNETDTGTPAGGSNNIFAVYSADDGSLIFYSGDDRTVPDEGDEFNGKTATDVYTDLGNTGYRGDADVPWRNDHGADIISVSFADAVSPTNTACWFAELSNCESVSLTNLDTSSATSMNQMFSGCEILKTLDLSSFDTSSVTDMASMFYDCRLLETLDLSSFDTSSVTDMSGMFYDCVSLTTLNLGSFDTSSVTDMSFMFYDAQSLGTLDLSSFDTSSVTDMSGMFGECRRLAKIYVSSLWNTDGVVSSTNMFRVCNLLTGGNGTSFSSDHTDAEYARIDAEGIPGYLTQGTEPGPEGEYVTVSATVTGLSYGTYTVAETAWPDEWEFVSLTAENGTADVEEMTATFELSSDNVTESFVAEFTDGYIPEGSITVTKVISAGQVEAYRSNYGGSPKVEFTLTDSDGNSEIQSVTFTADAVTESTDADGNVSLSAEFEGLALGSYALEETSMPDGWEFKSLTSENGTVNGQTVEFELTKADAHNEFSATFSDEYLTGNITVSKKVSAEQVSTYRSVYGEDPSMTFTLTDGNGVKSTRTVEFTADAVTDNTDSDGYVTLTAEYTLLELGTYTLEETAMPDGWEFKSVTAGNGTVSGQTVEFPLTAENHTEEFTAAFTDEYPTGSVTVTKKVLASDVADYGQDAEFTFTLYGANGGEEGSATAVVEYDSCAGLDEGTYVTASVIFENLEYGEYTVKETAMPDNWVFDSLVADDGTVSGSTATFVLSADNITREFTAVFTDVYSPEGVVTVEKKVLASDIVAYNDNASFTFTLYNGSGESVGVRTATISLADCTGQDEGTYVTASVTFTNLTQGTYTLKETSMPEDWEFVSLDTENGEVSGSEAVFKITKAEYSKVFTATFTDEYSPEGEITVTKKVPASDVVDYGQDMEVTFTLYDGNGAQYAEQTVSFLLTDCTGLDEGAYVEAEAVFEDLEPDEYTLKETAMPDDWELSLLESSTGTVSSDGKSVTFTITKANTSEAFGAVATDTYSPEGEVTVTKKVTAGDLADSESGGSFTFTLYNADGESVGVQTVTILPDAGNGLGSDEYVTAEAVFTGLEPGTYTLKETGLAAGWEFKQAESSTGTVSGDGKSVTFTITKANASESFGAEFTNGYTGYDNPGTITIIKYGSDGSTPLKGVGYTLYDSEGEVAGTGTTDDDGKLVFTGLVAGTYRITETSTVSGYSLLADAIDVTMPLVLTEDELAEYKASGITIDVTDAVKHGDEYWFYDLTYEITDTAVLSLPLTGAAGTLPKALLIAGLAAVALAMLRVPFGKKRKRKAGAAA